MPKIITYKTRGSWNIHKEGGKHLQDNREVGNPNSRRAAKSIEKVKDLTKEGKKETLCDDAAMTSFCLIEWVLKKKRKENRAN